MVTDLLEYYIRLTDTCPIKNINSKFSYYLSDELDVNIKCESPIIYYDIESAFPSILHLLLDGNADAEWYLNEMDSLESDKIKRLIFISTNAPKVKPNLLQELNSMAKIVIFSKVYNMYDNVQIIEYKKDSILAKADLRSKPKYKKVKRILDKHFKFHIETDMISYYRFEKTSIYVRSNGIEMKGTMKNMPPFIINSVIPMLKNIAEDITFQNTIMGIYSSAYYLTLVKFGRIDDIRNYYSFGNKYLSNYKRSLVYDHTPDCAPAVLLKVIYPLIALYKSRS